MTASKLIPESEHAFEESRNQRDARIEQLWASLGPSRKGVLDLTGLRKGFRKLDHPMKHADAMLKKILEEVDTNRDGEIEFEEFRTFVEHAELQLYTLFRSIDKDGNGKLDKRELQAAFKNAGITVANQRLNSFFGDMDNNNDGYITFAEWRDFLLFMPAGDHESKLRAMLSFYDAVVSVTPEGESLVTEESLEGLGTDSSSSSLLHILLGSLLRVASPATQRSLDDTVSRSSEGWIDEDHLTHHNDAPVTAEELKAVDVASHSIIKAAVVEQRHLITNTLTEEAEGGTQEVEDHDEHSSTTMLVRGIKKFRLTSFIPDPGYFLAGAIAGGVSRTATAPLDRLKVYLLVNTNTGPEKALAAVVQGRPAVAAKNAARPFTAAVQDLYRSGGFRGFFAGNGLNVVKIMPETAIKFGTYEAAKRALANFEGHGDPGQISSYSKFTAGGVAGMMAQFFVYPLDTLKFRLQCETVKGGAQGNALIRQTALKMWTDGGMRACYRGVTMGLIGMFPYSAIDMGTFELLKKTYREYLAKKYGLHEDDVEAGNIATGIIGATSGAFGATMVYPLNVVRTRLQTQGTVMHRATYTGIWDVTQKTIQKEGWRGLYKGLTPNLLKVAPALSITWVVYENSKKLLGLH